MDREQDNRRGRDLSQQPDDGRRRTAIGPNDETTNLTDMTGVSNSTPGTGPLGAIVPDMLVVGADGDEVGVVREVRGDVILVDRMTDGDVYVPVSAVQNNDGSELRLAVATTDI